MYYPTAGAFRNSSLQQIPNEEGLVNWITLDQVASRESSRTLAQAVLKKHDFTVPKNPIRSFDDDDDNYQTISSQNRTTSQSRTQDRSTICQDKEGNRLTSSTLENNAERSHSSDSNSEQPEGTQFLGGVDADNYRKSISSSIPESFLSQKNTRIQPYSQGNLQASEETASKQHFSATIITLSPGPKTNAYDQECTPRARTRLQERNLKLNTCFGLGARYNQAGSHKGNDSQEHPSTPLRRVSASDTSIDVSPINLKKATIRDYMENYFAVPQKLPCQSPILHPRLLKRIESVQLSNLRIPDDAIFESTPNISLTKGIFKKQFSSLVQDRLFLHLYDLARNSTTNSSSQRSSTHEPTHCYSSNQKGFAFHNHILDYAAPSPTFIPEKSSNITPPISARKKKVEHSNFKSTFLMTLFNELAELNIGSPFLEEEEASLARNEHNIASLLNGWIKGSLPGLNLIYTFDFLMNHVSLVVTLIYFWFSLDELVNPLLSPVELGSLEEGRNQIRLNILNILSEYHQIRSRELLHNPITIDLLMAFYNYVETQEEMYTMQIHNLIVEGKRKLRRQIRIETSLEEKLESSRTEVQYMEHMFKNYNQKDKLIRDKLEDVADTFYEVDRVRALRMPLGIYFGLAHKETIRMLGERHTMLACWLLGIVLNKCRTNAYQAIEYVYRFYSLAQELYSRLDFHGAIFFTGMVMNIREYLPQLYRLVVETKRIDICRDLTRIYESISRDGQLSSSNSTILDGTTVILDNSKLFSSIQGLKAKFQGHTRSLSFHSALGNIAQLVTKYQKNLQRLDRESADSNFSSSFRVNLGHKFMHQHIYEFLDSQSNLTAHSRYQQFKKKAEKVDGQLCFPLLFRFL